MLKNKSFKETFWGVMGKGAAFVLSFLIIIIMARGLGAKEFGLWSFFFSIISIFLIFSNFGINESTRKYIAQYNETEKLRNIIESSFKLRFIFSIIFAISLFIFSEKIAFLIGFPDFKILFQYSSPLIFFIGFLEYFKEIFIGFRRIFFNFIINFLEFGFKLIFILLFFNFSINLLSVVNAFNLAVFIAFLAGLFILYNVFYRKTSFFSKKNFMVAIFKYSFPLFFVSIGVLAATELDTIMLGFLSSSKEVGIYSVAKQIVTKIPHISLALSMGTLPIFAKLNKNNKYKLKKIFFKSLKFNILIVSAITALIFLSSGYFVPLLFGSEYVASVFSLQILAFYMFYFPVSMFFSSFLDYQGMAKKKLFNLSVSVVLNILLNFVLIPKFGAAGAAFATAVSYIPYMVLNWFEVKKVFES